MLLLLLYPKHVIKLLGYNLGCYMYSNHKIMKYIFMQRDLNIRQRGWMEFLEDYDFTLHYHPGKENVVVDALSRKSRGALASIASRVADARDCGTVGLQYSEQTQGTLRSLVATPSLLSRVIESQGQDAEIVSIRDRAQSGTGDEGWTIHTYGSLQYRGRVVVPHFYRFERGDSQGVSLHSICRASRWHEDVPRSSSSVLLERDEETRRGLFLTMSHMSAG